MARNIQRVAVLGAGVMGSGIAAHLAGVGIDVTLLLDIVPPELEGDARKNKAERDRFASSGVQTAIKAKPPAFYNKSDAALIEVGNLEDDLEKIGECATGSIEVDRREPRHQAEASSRGSTSCASRARWSPPTPRA
jgi:3-hydroxyacyl-CoA dehydrogenase